jgi:hypothetical protein
MRPGPGRVEHVRRSELCFAIGDRVGQPLGLEPVGGASRTTPDDRVACHAQADEGQARAMSEFSAHIASEVSLHDRTLRVADRSNRSQEQGLEA